jgi:hypothetical protein
MLALAAWFGHYTTLLEHPSDARMRKEDRSSAFARKFVWSDIHTLVGDTESCKSYRQQLAVYLAALSCSFARFQPRAAEKKARGAVDSRIPSGARQSGKKRELICRRYILFMSHLPKTPKVKGVPPCVFCQSLSHRQRALPREKSKVG